MFGVRSLLCGLEAVAQGHDTIVHAGVLRVGSEETGAHELELIAGLCVGQSLFQLAALAWLLQKVASPVVGATKLHHIEGAVAALDLKLTPDDMAYLEEMYIPHRLVGVMALNKKKPTEKATWSTGNQVIK